MNIYVFIKPLGIIAYGMVFITAISGILHWKIKQHKLLAIIALAIVTIHALIVLPAR